MEWRRLAHVWGDGLAGVRGTLAAMVTVCATAVALPVQAEEFPTKPVVMVIPFAAGGPTDAIGRVIAQSMSKTLGQQVVVENVTGAGGTLARQKVAESKPDGYTMMLAGLGTSTSVTLYRKLPYDPHNAFDGVGLIARVPMMVIGRKNLPAKDIGELIRYIKEKKEEVNYGHGGLGSGSQFCGLLMMAALQVKMNQVAYRGSGPAMLDVLGGRIDLLCDQTTTAAPHAAKGAVKAFAVTTSGRIPSAPDLPTLDEAGLKNFELSNWYGLMVRNGTPKPYLDKLSDALRAALKDPTVLKRFEQFGALPARDEEATPAEFMKFFRAEVARWAPIIKANGVYAN